jgi:4-hydroxy-tetrahydrodipicolinate synthase
MAGASGWAPVCTNFVPGDAMRFFAAAVQKRDASAAQTIWDKLFPVCDFICAKSHIRVAHTGLDILGRPVGPPRRPLRMLNAEDRSRLAMWIFPEAGVKKGDIKKSSNPST